MSKSAIVSTEVQPAAPVPAVQPKPPVIHISGLAHIAFAEAAIHIRQGYIFSESRTPEILVQTGQAILTLELGTPDQYAIDLAKASTAHAIDLQNIAYQKDVEAAAKTMIEAAAKAEKQAKIAAEVNEAKKVLRRLTDQAAAAA